jgi:sodium-dependent dicarboxylate transporter 2/3/5
MALTISNQIQDKERARELCVLLILGIAYAASLGGMVTITGSASNAVASEFLGEIFPWTFLDWMKYGAPSLLILFPLTWWLLRKLYPISVSTMDIDLARKELTNLGNLRPQELEILLIMTLTILMWMGGSLLESSLRIPLKFMSPPVVGMISVAYLSLRGIIEWEDVKGVSWGMFFAIAAGLALGESLVRSGATEWLTDLVTPFIGGTPILISIFFVVYLSALLTNIINNATVAAVFVPIIISLAWQNPALNAIQLVLPLALATTFGYALPSSSGRMALISATGLVPQKDMIKIGLVMTLISSIVLVFFFYSLVVLNLV